MLRVLLVDPDPRDGARLQSQLDAHGFATRLVRDADSALAVAMAGRAHVVITALALPTVPDGARLVRALRAHAPAVRVLVLSARAGPADRLAAFDAGADAFARRESRWTRLAARVHALLGAREDPRDDPRDGAPGRSHDGSDDRAPDERACPAVRAADAVPRDVRLRAKERALLQALLARRGAVVSRDELMRVVWDYASDVTSRTLDAHVCTLRRKLAASEPAPPRIVTIPGIGYRVLGGAPT